MRHNLNIKVVKIGKLIYFWVQNCASP